MLLCTQIPASFSASKTALHSLHAAACSHHSRVGPGVFIYQCSSSNIKSSVFECRLDVRASVTRNSPGLGLVRTFISYVRCRHPAVVAQQQQFFAPILKENRLSATAFVCLDGRRHWLARWYLGGETSSEGIRVDDTGEAECSLAVRSFQHAQARYNHAQTGRTRWRSETWGAVTASRTSRSLEAIYCRLGGWLTRRFQAAPWEDGCT